MTLDLDEAIAHCHEKAEEQKQKANSINNNGYGLEADQLNEQSNCLECANEHQQLAEWLTELQERREADRWIPVSERLPDNDDFVLVYDNLEMFVAWFSEEHGWCSFDGNFDENTPIIAWKPLPKPYKENDK